MPPVCLAEFPSTLVAGDSLILAFADAAYPPGDGWAAQLVFTGPAQVVVEGEPDPDAPGGFLLTLGATASAELAAGTYGWALVLANEGDDVRATVARGALTVVADPSSQTGETEQRSFAVQKLEALEAALLVKGDATSYSLFGRTYSFESHEALLKAREWLLREVRAEQEAQRQALGQPSHNTVWVRFGMES